MSKKINYLCTTFIGTLVFLLFAIFNNVNVNAFSYTYTDGINKVVHSEVVVNEIYYSYMVQFTDIDDYGVNIRDGNTNLMNVNMYAGESVTIKIQEVEKKLFNKNSDSTTIYQYNKERNDFSANLVSFVDENNEYVLKTKGIYKIVYNHEKDNVTHINYVYVNPDLIYASVKGDRKYENTSVFGEFSFDLKLEDAYDLTKNSYYYAFGKDSEGLSFTKIKNEDIFSVSGEVKELNQKLSVKVLSKYLLEDEQYFFIKIVRNVNGNEKEFVLSTSKTYKLVDSIEAFAFIKDDEGNIINEEKFYKKDDVIHFEIQFNTKVTYSGLKYSVFASAVPYISLEDASVETDTIKIDYIVNGLYSYSSDGDGDFALLSEGLSKAMVKVNGDNVSVTVDDSNVHYVVDIDNPVLNYIEDPYDEYVRRYSTVVSVKDDKSGIKNVTYYVDRCKIMQDNQCKDLFDNTREDLVEANYLNDVGNDKIYEILIDSSLGKFNGEVVTVYIKIEDGAGNFTTVVKSGFLIDNVIVESDRLENVIKIEDISEGGSVVGKSLIIDTLSEDNVISVRYGFETASQECNVVSESVDSKKFECLSVRYHFKSNVLLTLEDKYGNIEEYVVEFKYNTLKDQTLVVGEKTFNIHSNAQYDISTEAYNIMMDVGDTERFALDSSTLNKIIEALGINNIPVDNDVKFDIVMIEDDVIVVRENVSGEKIEFPTLLELIENVKYLDKYKMCSIKGNSCELVSYLKVYYSVNGIDQERLIQVKFKDNSLKYSIDEFESDVVVNVNGAYQEIVYDFMDSLNNLINKENVSENKTITFTSSDGNSNVVSEIDTSKVGIYTVEQSFTYGELASYPLVYSVTVKDTEAPVVRLLVDDEISIKVGENLDFSKIVKVIDNYDKNLEIISSSEPNLDVNKKGKYVISLWAVDSNNNKSNVVTVTVFVGEKQNSLDYWIAGGIILGVALIIVVTTIIEIKKSKKRISRE